jgi:hypothetical protein
VEDNALEENRGIKEEEASTEGTTSTYE